MSLRLSHITKRFGAITAVDDVSFTVREGAVFGFLGSNGSGKTTTIRMLLRIFLPDQGEITWQDTPLTTQTARQFGYLPEERGLYPKMQVLEQLVYLATLRGASKGDARLSVMQWLDRLEIAEHTSKRVEQLSKGNQQKVQFIAAVAHQPKLVILDEPFSGLDPVNAHVLQASLRHLQQQGTTILFSSHRLDQVEQLCTEVALIHRAKLMLAGPIEQVRRASGRLVVRVAMTDGRPFRCDVDALDIRERPGGIMEYVVPQGTDTQAILHAALLSGPVRHFEVDAPSLEEVYLASVKGVKA